MKLGIDIDGVLADFNTSFIHLVKQQTGIQLPPVSDTYPDTWSYHRAGGVTEKQDNALWEFIKTSSFWGQLLPMKGALDALERLNSLSVDGHDIYFITARPGKLAKFFTDLWLQRHGMVFPTTLVTSNKGPVVVGLGLDIFVDDKPENNLEVLTHCELAKVRAPWVYLVDAPYNKWATNAKDYGVRVASLMDVLELNFPKLRRIA